MSGQRARGLRIAIGALAVLLILIGVWAALRQHASPRVPAPTVSIIKDQTWDETAKPAAAARSAIQVSSLWVRPPAEVASRNRRKSGFALVLKQLGATDQQLNRLVGGDLVGVVTELKQKAQAGDPVSIQVLGQFALMSCGPSRGRWEAFKSRQIPEAQALSQPDRDWFTTTVNDDIAFDRQTDSVCDQIDTKEVLSWVTARANQGDGASLWVLSQSGLEMKDMQQRFREASAAGFALAQSILAD